MISATFPVQTACSNGRGAWGRYDAPQQRRRALESANGIPSGAGRDKLRLRGVVGYSNRITLQAGRSMVAEQGGVKPSQRGDTGIIGCGNRPQGSTAINRNHTIPGSLHPTNLIQPVF